ncbi:MAG: hypothetical protein AABY18_03160 [Candidatus Thermoplasmatota archaeon]
MALTSIPLDSKVRDRLKGYGTSGMTYNDILLRLMDRFEEAEFFAQIRRDIEKADAEGSWVDLEDI